jgi:hypothetical protein
MGYIYRFLFPSGKSYVGQTTQHYRKRWWSHKNSLNEKKKGCRVLKMAIQKYGWESIKKYVVANAPDNELDRLEIEFIQKYDSYHNGYNLTLGGDANPMKNGDLKEYHKQRLKETGHAARTSKAIREFHRDEEKHAAWLVNQRASHRTDEHRVGQSKRSKKMWEQHRVAGKDRGSAISAALNDPEYKAARAKRRANDPREKARIAKIKATYARKKAEACNAHPGSQ